MLGGAGGVELSASLLPCNVRKREYRDKQGELQIGMCVGVLNGCEDFEKILGERWVGVTA